MGHKVQGGERLDLIAHNYLRDPQRFWRICDCNQVVWPEELVNEPGRKIDIPASEG